MFYDVTEEDDIERRLNRLRRAYRMQRRTGAPVLVISSSFLALDPRVIVVNAGHVATTQARDCARWLVESGRCRVTIFIDAGDRTLAFERLLKVVPELLRLQPSTEIAFVIRSHRTGSTPNTVLRAAGAVRDWDWVMAMMSRYEAVSDDRVIDLFHFVPTLQQAFGRFVSSDTWLLPHTPMAAEALEWLDRTGIDHSHRPGVVTFDNTVYTRHRGISCCVPDWDRLGYLMAHGIIGDIPLERSRHGFVHCGSLVLRRETLG